MVELLYGGRDHGNLPWSLRSRIEYIEEMTSVRWGATQERHDFNTIGHSIDENETAGPGFHKRSADTGIYPAYWSEMVSNNAQWWSPFHENWSFQQSLPPFFLFSYLSENMVFISFWIFINWNQLLFDYPCVRPSWELFSHTYYELFNRMWKKKKEIFRKQL